MPAAAPSIREERVDFGALLTPDSEAAVPGVVLIHDVWGLADHTRDISRRLAAEGFSVLAIDLYRNHANVDLADPGRWMQELSDPDIVADLAAAAGFLGRHASVAGRPVGVVGFCMGGMYALLAACLADGFAASVPFYGLLSHRHGLLFREGGLDAARKPREPIELGAQLRCPLLAFFGDEDPMIPLGDVRELEASLARAEVPSEVVVVEGAGHAFMNDTRDDAYRPQAAGAAWRRMVDFLRVELCGPDGR